MKKAKKAPKQAAKADSTGRANNYQVSRSLPDLRNGQPPGRPAGRRPATKALKKAKKPASRRRKIIKRTLLVLLLALLLIGGWLGYKAYINGNKFGGLWSLFDNSKLKGEDRGHINILLAGDSSDDPGHQGAKLTDSIMLISINPQNKTAFLVSIPRDLYVNIPGYGYAKINEAYQRGEDEGFNEAGYAPGGMGLLQKTVSQKFDIPIDYYALINYTAFKDAVNAVGGVDITIDSGNRYGIYDPYANLKLPNGRVHLDGQTALNLSRARGAGPGSYGVASDYDRTTYQRNILLAIKDKATSTGVLANPIKLGNLLDAGGKNVKTDLTLGNLRRLNNLTQGMDTNNIKSVGLDEYNGVRYVVGYTAPGGLSTQIPAAGLNNYTQIQALIKELLNSQPASPPPTN